jgi:hypothetical protein
MATTRKKTTKKKTAAKRKATRKKPARKKPARKKAAKKKSTKHCHFGHRSGCASEVGCGLTDSVTVFKDSDGQYYVLSVNYTEGYACVEILDDDHDDPIVGIQFMGPDDMAKAFAKDITKIPSKELASALAGMCL